MDNVIRNFTDQFKTDLELKSGESLSEKNYVIVVGMGGSGLAPDLIRAYDKSMPILVHKNYGLPNLDEEIIKESVVVAVSFSGNTNETISAFEEAISRGISTIAITKGGKLLDLAKEKNIPHLILPDEDIPSRMALGYHIIALLTVLGEEELLHEFRNLANLDFFHCENYGKEISERLRDKIPIIYGSEKNSFISYNWKINFNETSKIPSYAENFPELGHNEIEGFESGDSSNKFSFVFLEDVEDHSEIQKKMIVLGNIYKSKGLEVVNAPLRGEYRLERIFSSIISSYWTSFDLALARDVNPFKTKIVEDFKKLLI